MSTINPTQSAIKSVKITNVKQSREKTDLCRKQGTKHNMEGTQPLHYGILALNGHIQLFRD